MVFISNLTYRIIKKGYICEKRCPMLDSIISLPHCNWMDK